MKQIKEIVEDPFGKLQDLIKECEDDEKNQEKQLIESKLEHSKILNTSTKSHSTYT